MRSICCAKAIQSCAVLRQNHDAGIDGISGSDSDPEFILVVTTAQDFARNLRRSVERYVSAGGPAAPLCLRQAEMLRASAGST